MTVPPGYRPARLDPRPAYRPRTALGWSDVALDGLNCVLRCVEATLAYKGLAPLEVARALGGAPDLLLRDYSTRFPAAAVRWRETDDGTLNWPLVHEWLAAGEPVVVMPDRFFWPGDEFEGRRHVHDHAVLAFASDQGRLWFLDTDARPEDEFVGSHEVSGQLAAACTRVGRVHLDQAALDRSRPDDYAAAQAAAMGSALARDIPALRDFLGLLPGGLDSDVARGLHIIVLGQLQPGIFLFARSLDGVTQPRHQLLREQALTAAAKAKQLGLGLIAAHRYGTEQVYRAAMKGRRDLVAALGELGETAGIPRDAAADAGAVQRWLERLQEVVSWCYTSLDQEGRSSRELAHGQLTDIVIPGERH